jgi:hypothetical protein
MYRGGAYFTESFSVSFSIIVLTNEKLHYISMNLSVSRNGLQ